MSGIRAEYQGMEHEELIKILQGKYMEKVKTHGRKKKTPEEVFRDIMDWHAKEEESISGEFDEKMRKWEAMRRQTEEWFGDPINSEKPRKSNKLRVELRDLELTLQRKINRLKGRHPEWWSARNKPVEDRGEDPMFLELLDAIRRGKGK